MVVVIYRRDDRPQTSGTATSSKGSLPPKSSFSEAQSKFVIVIYYNK